MLKRSFFPLPQFFSSSSSSSTSSSTCILPPLISSLSFFSSSSNSNSMEQKKKKKKLKALVTRSLYRSCCTIDIVSPEARTALRYPISLLYNGQEKIGPAHPRWTSLTELFQKMETLEEEEEKEQEEEEGKKEETAAEKEIPENQQEVWGKFGAAESSTNQEEAQTTTTTTLSLLENYQGGLRRFIETELRSCCELENPQSPSYVFLLKQQQYFQQQNFREQHHPVPIRARTLPVEENLAHLAFITSELFFSFLPSSSPSNSFSPSPIIIDLHSLNEKLPPQLRNFINRRFQKSLPHALFEAQLVVPDICWKLESTSSSSSSSSLDLVDASENIFEKQQQDDDDDFGDDDEDSITGRREKQILRSRQQREAIFRRLTLDDFQLVKTSNVPPLPSPSSSSSKTLDELVRENREKLSKIRQEAHNRLAEREKKMQQPKPQQKQQQNQGGGASPRMKQENPKEYLRLRFSSDNNLTSSEKSSVRIRDLLPFVPSFFVPTDVVIDEQPDFASVGYTREHLETFFGSHKSMQLIRLNERSFIRIHGRHGRYDMSPIVQANERFERFDPNPDASSPFLEILQKEQQKNPREQFWMPLRKLLELAGKDAEQALPYQGPEALLFFAQLQHKFAFSPQNGGMVALAVPPSELCLTHFNTPCPLFFNQLFRLCSVFGLEGVFSLDANKIEEFFGEGGTLQQPSRVILEGRRYFPSIADFVTAHSSKFVLDLDTMKLCLRTTYEAQRVKTCSLDEQISFAMNRGNVRKVRKLMRIRMQEENPNHPLLHDDNIAQEIYDTLPSKAGSYMLTHQLSRALSRELLDLLPNGGLRTFLPKYSHLFRVFDVGFKRVGICRADLQELPQEAIVSSTSTSAVDYSEMEHQQEQNDENESFESGENNNNNEGKQQEFFQDDDGGRSADFYRGSVPEAPPPSSRDQKQQHSSSVPVTKFPRTMNDFDLSSYFAEVIRETNESRCSVHRLFRHKPAGAGSMSKPQIVNFLRDFPENFAIISDGPDDVYITLIKFPGF